MMSMRLHQRALKAEVALVLVHNSPAKGEIYEP